MLRVQLAQVSLRAIFKKALPGQFQADFPIFEAQVQMCKDMNSFILQNVTWRHTAAIFAEQPWWPDGSRQPSSHESHSYPITTLLHPCARAQPPGDTPQVSSAHTTYQPTAPVCRNLETHFSGHIRRTLCAYTATFCPRARATLQHLGHTLELSMVTAMPCVPSAFQLQGSLWSQCFYRASRGSCGGRSWASPSWAQENPASELMALSLSSDPAGRPTA